MLFYVRKPRLQSQPLTGVRATQSYSLVPVQHLPSAAVFWPSLQSLIAHNAPLCRRHHSSAATVGAAVSADQMHLHHWRSTGKRKWSSCRRCSARWIGRVATRAADERPPDSLERLVATRTRRVSCGRHSARLRPPLARHQVPSEADSCPECRLYRPGADAGVSFRRQCRRTSEYSTRFKGERRRSEQN